MSTNRNEALRAALEPCPLCQTEASIVFSGEVGRFDQYDVDCTGCGLYFHGPAIAEGEAAKAATIAAWNRRPSPVAGGDLRDWPDQIFRSIAKSKDVATCRHRVATLFAALNQPAAPVEAGLLDRAELAWQRFFYPAADCFTGPIGDKLPSVDLEVADCLRLVLAAIGRHVAAPDQDVPAPVEAVEPIGYMTRDTRGKIYWADEICIWEHKSDAEEFAQDMGDGNEVVAIYAHPPEPAASTDAAAVGGQVCGFCQGNWCARGLCPECGSPEIVAARAAAKQGQSEPFAREDRFIVIKRKHLTPSSEGAIRNQLAALGVPTVECVVVESDWPEYETVWRMIEDRVTGRTRPSDGSAGG